MKKLQIKKGNYGFNLRFTIEEDGAPKDISGLTAVLKVWKSGTLKFTRTCSIPNGTDGVVFCLVEQGDFDETGAYLAEIELQGAGYVEDTETFVIEVLESL